MLFLKEKPSKNMVDNVADYNKLNNILSPKSIESDIVPESKVSKVLYLELNF